MNLVPNLPLMENLKLQNIIKSPKGLELKPWHNIKKISMLDIEATMIGDFIKSIRSSPILEFLEMNIPRFASTEIPKLFTIQNLKYLHLRNVKSGDLDFLALLG